MSSLDTILLSFPNKDIDYPTLPLPILTAAVKQAGFTIQPRDIDVELKDAITQPEFLESLCDEILPALLVANANNGEVASQVLTVLDLLHEIREKYSFDALCEMKTFMQTRRYSEVFGTREATDLCRLFYRYLTRMIIFCHLLTTNPLIEKAFPEALPFRFVNDLCEDIIAKSPPLLSISYEGVQRPFTFWFLRKIRREFGYQGKIVTGGPDPTFYREKILQHFPEIDYLVYTEGELSLPPLIDHIRGGSTALKDIPNLIYRNEAGEIQNTQASILHEIPDIVPDFSELRLDLYVSPVLPIQASRGCSWGKCRFCMHYKTYSQDFYKSPAKQVVDHMEALQKKHAVSYFYFADDDFSTEFRTEIADEILARDLNVKTLGYARFAKDLTPEILKRWKKAGMLVLEFGMESGSQKVVNHIKKGFQVDKALHTLINAAELGLISKLLMFHDFPGETYEDLQLSIDLVTKLSRFGLVRYFIELRTKLELQPISPLYHELQSPTHPDHEYYKKIWKPRGDFSINTAYRYKENYAIKTAMLEKAIEESNALAAQNGIVTTNDVNLSIDLILEDLKEQGLPLYAENQLRGQKIRA